VCRPSLNVEFDVSDAHSLNLCFAVSFNRLLQLHSKALIKNVCPAVSTFCRINYYNF